MSAKKHKQERHNAKIIQTMMELFALKDQEQRIFQSAVCDILKEAFPEKFPNDFTPEQLMGWWVKKQPPKEPEIKIIGLDGVSRDVG